MAKITGQVSWHAGEDTEWHPAILNYPVSTGDAFWTEPQALAEIELSGNRILVMSTTELDVTHKPRPAGEQSGNNPRVIARAFRELSRMRRSLAA